MSQKHTLSDIFGHACVASHVASDQPLYLFLICCRMGGGGGVLHTHIHFAK